MPAPTAPAPPRPPSFTGTPGCDDLDALRAEVAVIGVFFGAPYDTAAPAPCASHAQPRSGHDRSGDRAGRIGG